MFLIFQEGILQSFFDRKGSTPPIDESSPFAAGFLRIIEGFIKAVDNYGDCDNYAAKIKSWNKQKLMSQYIDVSDPMRCDFVVMNHGDLWLNNMMFKFENGKPLEVSMIDYQAPFWGSPANDILYFLLTSVQDDIKVEHFDEFIEFYHEQLSTSLKKLNYDRHIPTLAELHIDLLDKGGFGEFVITLSSPQIATFVSLQRAHASCSYSLL
jgi:thiamine kinase-like enzyme